VKGVLASYRWRRRLVWLTTTAVVVAGVVAVALVWPNTAPKEPPVSNIPLHIDYRPPKSVRLKLHDKALALAVASRFIDTAVARKDIDRSWDLVAPEFRAGLTRKQWDQGTMPVPPYPVREARWKLDFADVKGVGFQIALFPTKGSHQRAQVFLIGLHAVHLGKQQRWLVDSWQAAPTRGLQAGTPVGNGSGSVIEQVTPRLSPAFSKSKESPAWLLLPVGLLSLIVLIPLGIATVNWYRDRRARALLGP
jgi:hypothetical protein